MASMGRLAFLVIFAVLTALLWAQGGNSTTAANLDTPDAVRSYINAWTQGNLHSQSYDPGSDPDVRKGNGRLIEKNTAWMTRGISPYDKDHPIRIVTVGSPQEVTASSGELKANDLVQAVDVTWDLGNDRTWTYRTNIVTRTTDGQTRVVWRPSSVYPGLTHGLILTNKRLRPDRAPVLDGADRTVASSLARPLIGTTAVASHELAETYPARVEPGDIIGTGGLQHTYDTRLAGTTGLEVDLQNDPEYKQIQPTVRPVYVTPPVPGEPLHLSLDSALQRHADSVVAGARTPTAIVAIDAMNGKVLAAATGGGGRANMALQARYPAGLALRPVSLLATMRHGSPTLDSSVECSPVEVQGQRFVAPAGAAGQGSTTLQDAYLRRCSPGIVRSVVGLDPNNLPDAAAGLGLLAPDTTGADAFSGVVPSTSGPLSNAQNALGEGGVLTSPFALARMAATIAVGAPRASVLVRDVGPNAADPSATELPPPGAANPDRTPSPSASERAVQAGATTQPGPELSAQEQTTLAALMRNSTATDVDLAPLRAAGLQSVSALVATAGYGPSAAAPRYGWCVGFRGNLAFAVLVTGETTNAGRGYQAAQVAAAFLR